MNRMAPQQVPSATVPPPASSAPIPNHAPSSTPTQQDDQILLNKINDLQAQLASALKIAEGAGSQAKLAAKTQEQIV